jgi:hypothetical protein
MSGETYWNRHLPDGSDLMLSGQPLWCKKISVSYGRRTVFIPEAGGERVEKERLLINCVSHTWPAGAPLEGQRRGYCHPDAALLIGDETVLFGLSIVVNSEMLPEGNLALMLERMFSPAVNREDFDNSHTIFPELRHKLQVGPEYQGEK